MQATTCRELHCQPNQGRDNELDKVSWSTSNSSNKLYRTEVGSVWSVIFIGEELSVLATLVMCRAHKDVPSNNLSFYIHIIKKRNTICIRFLRNYWETFYLHCWIFAGRAEWSWESGWTLSTKVSLPAGVKTTSLLAQGGTKTKLKKCLWISENQFCKKRHTISNYGPIF